MALAIATVVGFGAMDVDFGGRHLTSEEAWHLGVVLPYVVGGCFLIVLAALLFAGYGWVRWAIMLWLPVMFAVGVPWSVSRGVGVFNPIEFVLEGLPVIAVWILANWWELFRNSDSASHRSTLN